MIEERKKANVIENLFDNRALAYESNVKPYLSDLIREHIDKLELVVDNEMWPLPKYRELLFTTININLCFVIVRLRLMSPADCEHPLFIIIVM